MKRSLLILGLCLGMAAGVSGEAVPGKAAPAFRATDLEGKVHQLSDFKGKIVVLEAYNLDCPFCAHHYQTGAMQDLQAWARSKGVVWLLVNSVHRGNPSHRDPAAAKKEFARQKIKATAWLEDASGQVGKAYGLRTTPHLVVIDPTGVVAYAGAIDDQPATSGDPRKARNYVREALEALLAGKPVEVATTKPYGCSVKYQ